LLGHRIEHELAVPWFCRDNELIHRMIGTGERYASFFCPEVRGIENVPRSGPTLLVGNHSGLFYMPDVWITGLSVVRRRGLD